MKRILSIILAVLLLLSATVTAYAESVYNPFGWLYLGRYCEEYSRYTVYQEDYVHRVNPVDPDSPVDWAFVCAYTLFDAFTAEYYSCYAVIGEKFIKKSGIYEPFQLEYAIYDVEKDTFIDLVDVNLDEYDGLEEYINTCERLGFPVGDADRDKKLSVMDATLIQMSLTFLCESYVFNEIEGEPLNENLTNLSDYDRDGEISVMDATAIQMKLAEV